MREIEIPFNKDGDLINYPMSYDTIVWKQNFKFDETIKLESISRGCSAANFIVTDSKKKRYTLFMKDLFDACQNSTVKSGKIKGTFCFVKRGRNYGIKLIK